MALISGVQVLQRIRRNVERELASRVLIAAMLAPLVAFPVGWTPSTPLGVPLALHSAILFALALLMLGRFHPRETHGAHRLTFWISTLILGFAVALLLHERANAFYTAKALMEGLALLFVVHLGVCALRHRATALLATTPAVRLADRLTTVVGWCILASWVLIAREHRHIVGPLLIGAGILETVAFIVLIPRTMPRSRLLARMRRPASPDGG